MAAVFAIALTSLATLAASQFEGVWKVQDTSGKPFQITLSGDGSAKADRAGEGLTGMWKEEGGAAVIKWHTGWTTKITKEGDKRLTQRHAAGWAADPTTPMRKK